jgi:hypothetical protein
MKTLRLAIPFAAALAGCVAGIDGPSGGDDQPPVTTPPNTTPPPVIDPPPTAAQWKAGSLTPVFEYANGETQQKFKEGGRQFTDADFFNNANNFVTVNSKLGEISAFLAKERGLTTPVQFASAQDLQRGQQIPFRGKPNDIKLFNKNGLRRAFSTLGGDQSVVGNEVAMVDLNNNGLVQRIKVCLSPQRVAVVADLVFVVCEYSNYLMVIDPKDGELLRGADGQPVKVPTEFYGTDLVAAPVQPGIDDQDNFNLLIANNARHSVIKRPITIVRDARTDDPVDIKFDKPATELAGVGSNPYRVVLGQDQRTAYVTNNRGGELALINIGNGDAPPTVKKRVALPGVTIEVVQLNDVVIGATGPWDRGTPFSGATKPIDVDAPPVEVQGLDGASHVAHPGAIYDGTDAYNFEDVRAGMFTVTAQNLTQPTFFTNDNHRQRCRHVLRLFA